MNNFVYDGHILEVVAPYEVMNGDGLLCGSLFGIAASWAQKGEPVSISTTGVFDLKRQLSEDWGIGDPIYWNDWSKSFTREAVGAVMVGIAVAATTGAERPWVRGKLIGFALA